jgi:hypothetical protein
MRLRIRRAFVIVGVVICLAVGLGSIQVAAALTAAAAPPPAPPVSLDTLQTALADEQARGLDLQAQLGELNDLTASLSLALADTKNQVSTDGVSAKALSDRLKAAQSKLADLKRLLLQAQGRLRAMGGTVPRSGGGGGGGASSGGGGSGGGGGGGGGGSSPGKMSLTLSLGSGGVRADWSACSVSSFAGYALVRSTTFETHYPPENNNTEVARTNATAATDNAPSGRYVYTAYCLVTKGSGETKAATKSVTKLITVP